MWGAHTGTYHLATLRLRRHDSRSPLYDINGSRLLSDSCEDGEGKKKKNKSQIEILWSGLPPGHHLQRPPTGVGQAPGCEAAGRRGQAGQRRSKVSHVQPRVQSLRERAIGGGVGGEVPGGEGPAVVGLARNAQRLDVVDEAVGPEARCGRIVGGRGGCGARARAGGQNSPEEHQPVSSRRDAHRTVAAGRRACFAAVAANDDCVPGAEVSALGLAPVWVQIVDRRELPRVHAAGEDAVDVLEVGASVRLDDRQLVGVRAILDEAAHGLAGRLAPPHLVVDATAHRTGDRSRQRGERRGSAAHAVVVRRHLRRHDVAARLGPLEQASAPDRLGFRAQPLARLQGCTER